MIVKDPKRVPYGPYQGVELREISTYNKHVPTKWTGTWTLTTENTFIRYEPVMRSKSGDNAMIPSGGAGTPVMIGLLPSAMKHHSIMRLLYAAR